MAAPVTITVSGVNCRPLGCDLTFGVNMVPQANVRIDPTVGDLLQNTDKYRRTPCTVSISVGEAAITFPCLFDGLSFSASPGNTGYSAVFKSKHQTMLEVFPFAPGLHPWGANPYTTESVFETEGDSTTSFFTAIVMAAGVPALSKIDTGGNPAQALVAAMAGYVKSQQGITQTLFSSSLGQLIGQKLIKLAGPTNPPYQQALQVAQEVIADIDTSAVDAMQIKTISYPVMNFLSHILFDNRRQSLWEMMMAGLDSMGMQMIVGVNKLFIIPSGGFIAPSSHPVPNEQQILAQSNFASPAAVCSIVFNDSGYRNIGGVVLSASANFIFATDNDSSPGVNTSQSANVILDFGSYPATADVTANKQQGAVLVEQANELASLYISSFPAYTPVKDSIAHTTVDTQIDKDKATAAAQANLKAIANMSGTATQAILDSLAQTRFMMLKYGDRAGTITTLFNPAWCPGTTGTLYMRHPDPGGLFLDFNVSQVTHSFSVSEGGGSALTSISFNGGRTGTDPVGVTQNVLYGYGAAQMNQVIASFVSDIGGGGTISGNGNPVGPGSAGAAPGFIGGPSLQ